MHLLPRKCMSAMLDFICVGPVDLPGAHRKRLKEIKQFLQTLRLEPSTLRFLALCSTNFDNLVDCLVVCCMLKSKTQNLCVSLLFVQYIYIYIPMCNT